MVACHGRAGKRAVRGVMLASLLLDVYGLFGLAPKLMTWTMLIGTLAILIGAAGLY
jgi:uncharacterized membrane protein YdcZ (DUF606 family)